MRFLFRVPLRRQTAAPAAEHEQVAVEHGLDVQELGGERDMLRHLDLSRISDGVRRIRRQPGFARGAAHHRCQACRPSPRAAPARRSAAG
jgi:hypothetical protein